MNEATDVAVMAAEMRGHMKADETFQGRIGADMAEIKGMLNELSKDVKRGTERIHGRIDEEAEKSRAAVKAVDKRVDEQKAWTMSGVIAGLLGLVGFGAEIAIKKGGP